MGKKKKSNDRKGKKAPTKSIRVRVNKFYDVKNDKIERTGKDCPKCGAGVKMGLHKTKDGKTRYACGKCGMNIWE